MIVGTEVVHKECAKLGRVTERQRTARELATLQGNFEQTFRAAQEGVALGQQMKQLLEQTVGILNAEKLNVQQLTIRAQRAESMRDAALRDLTAIRAELATARVTPPTDSTPDSTADVRDDSEIRFSLLELDPT